MVYVMKIYTDGGCRRNGQPDAIGAASAAFRSQMGRYHSAASWTRNLPSDPRPTNQRAELTGIIIALEKALERLDDLSISRPKPKICLTVYTDSQYAVNCMTTWRCKWEKNGFTTYTDSEVVNQDLIEEAYGLHDLLRGKGHVTYTHISREKNKYADELCNRAMDQQ